MPNPPIVPNENPIAAGHRPALRVWPGAVLALLLLVLKFVVPVAFPEAAPVGVIGGLVCGLAILGWWLFFSRAPWSERLGAVGLMIVALFGTYQIVHQSIANGAMGMLFPMLAFPGMVVAFVVWAVASRGLSQGLRRATMVATIFLSCGVWALIRTGGFTANFEHDFAWRWTPTPEERLLAVTDKVPAVPPPIPATTKVTNDWPGFRGPGRDSIAHGPRIETDWTKSPPVELWRRPIGPGWSSFAVRGDRFYTQEQRGEEEVVACYNLATGEPVWRHGDATRFWESNAGAGPRATPTLSDGRVYTFGATGILNALDAATGAVVWSRNVVDDTGAKLPGWGFSSSPLVVGDVVVVHARVLVAYDCATGKPRWMGPARGGSYSSPHRVVIQGVEQVLLISGEGATSVASTDGKVLWQFQWPGTPIVQPVQLADGDLLLSTSGASGGMGMRRLTVKQGPGGWTVEERWTSNGLKPYFNDLVVHKDHAYGFDGAMLACIDITEGKRKWKDGRYGNGQFVLLTDQDLLVVLSEKGEIALVAATPDSFKELARSPAIKGKTWNHPVVVGDVLLVRNAEEMAAFRLALASR